MKIHDLPMVYVLMTTDYEYMKVGVTKNIKQRMRNIQSGCPFELFLYNSYRHVDYRSAQVFERTLIAILSDSHLRGEWFSPSALDTDLINSEFEAINKATRAKIDALL